MFCFLVPFPTSRRSSGSGPWNERAFLQTSLTSSPILLTQPSNLTLVVVSTYGKSSAVSALRLSVLLIRLAFFSLSLFLLGRNYAISELLAGSAKLPQRVLFALHQRRQRSSELPFLVSVVLHSSPSKQAAFARKRGSDSFIIFSLETAMLSFLFLFVLFLLPSFHVSYFSFFFFN